MKKIYYILGAVIILAASISTIAQGHMHSHTAQVENSMLDQRFQAEAARVGDWQNCPLIDPPYIPHIGGPILTGCPTVLIGGQPAARTGDQALCTGVGYNCIITGGSATVFIGGAPAARKNDTTNHGGVIIQGYPSVLIG